MARFVLLEEWQVQALVAYAQDGMGPLAPANQNSSRAAVRDLRSWAEGQEPANRAAALQIAASEERSLNDWHRGRIGPCK